MKRHLITFLTVLLSSGFLYASDEMYDSFKGSFGMYDMSTEMVVLKKIESETDPKTEKMILGGLSLKFDYFENELGQDKGRQVAYVHFSDNKDEYVLTYHVDGNSVVKIMLFSKNGEFINKELYPAKDPDKESGSEEKKQGK